MKLDTIQDIHKFSEQTFDVLKEYLSDFDLYPTDSCLIINIKTLDVYIGNVFNTKECDVYPTSSLTRLGEDNLIEPDIDTTFELSSKYLFIH